MGATIVYEFRYTGSEEKLREILELVYKSIKMQMNPYIEDMSEWKKFKELTYSDPNNDYKEIKRPGYAFGIELSKKIEPFSFNILKYRKTMFSYIWRGGSYTKT